MKKIIGGITTYTVFATLLLVGLSSCNNSVSVGIVKTPYEIACDTWIYDTSQNGAKALAKSLAQMMYNSDTSINEANAYQQFTNSKNAYPLLFSNIALCTGASKMTHDSNEFIIGFSDVPTAQANQETVSVQFLFYFANDSFSGDSIITHSNKTKNFIKIYSDTLL